MSVENEPHADSTTMKIAAVVIAVVILIGIGIYVYNKEKIGKSSDPAAEKIGKSSDPAAQQAALALLAGIPVHWAASKSGYSREQFGKPWTDEVGGVEFGRTAATPATTSCGGICQMLCLPAVACSCQAYCMTRIPALALLVRSIRLRAAARAALPNPRPRPGVDVGRRTARMTS